jgi:8-oxo-dGTP diphosphatase
MQKLTQIVRGIVINNDKILLCKNLKLGYYFLPGGHIEEGETPEIAFKREIIEEVGKVTLHVDKITEFENTFTQEGKEFSEVVYLYAATLENYDDIKSLENHIAFDWINIPDITKVDLRPQKIVQEILKIYLK